MKKVALIIFTVLSLAYVIASFVWTKVATQKELCRGVVVNVKSDSIKFLTSQFILDELKRMNFKVKGMPVNKINSQSVEKAFAPCVANMAVMGLVSLPGTMIGQLLGGSLPGVAIKYQMMIIIITFAASMLSLGITLYLADNRSFDKYGNLRNIFADRTL